jgi:hypothetical protein
MPLVIALANRVGELKELDLTGVSVATNWLVHRVTPLKKQLRPSWEYSDVQDLTREMSNTIEDNKMIEIL